MRILYISCGSGSDPTFGGSLVRTYEIASRVNKAYDIYLLTTTGGNRAIGRTIPTYVIDTPLGDFQMDRWFILRQLWSYLLVAIKSPFLKLPKVDIVYLDSDGLWDIIPAFFYKLKHPKVKIISMIHHLSSNPINKLLQRISLSILRKLADYFFILKTPQHCLIKHRLNIPCDKAYLVRNGIDTKLINSIPKQQKFYEACIFGTMRPGKGLQYILPVWRELRKYVPKAELLIIGDCLPEYRRYLDSPNIIITGYIPSKMEALRMIKRCKVFISLSTEEGWGIANMECVASGLKGVVWDLPAYKDILPSSVIRTELGDTQQFAKNIFTMLNYAEYFIDSNMNEYDWNNIVEEEIGYYEDMLRNK